MKDCLGFRGLVYDVVGLNFEVTHESPYDHKFTNEQCNLDARAFYDLFSQRRSRIVSGF